MGNGVLPTTQFAYLKGLGTCNALLCVFHILQSAIESGLESSIMKIEFSEAFDRVNHQNFPIIILYKYWRFCVVYIDTVPIIPITAGYVGRLSE